MRPSTACIAEPILEAEMATSFTKASHVKHNIRQDLKGNGSMSPPERTDLS
ncbi:hypothetical protein Plhal304r1_c042g0122111 [Plasmopara halstedii]